jgi:protein kinase A
MAATVASKPGPVPGVGQDSEPTPFMAVMDATGGALQPEGQVSEDAGPKVPPQHQRLKLTDFTLVRTLGTGMRSLS